MSGCDSRKNGETNRKRQKAISKTGNLQLRLLKKCLLKKRVHVVPLFDYTESFPPTLILIEKHGIAYHRLEHGIRLATWSTMVKLQK